MVLAHTKKKISPAVDLSIGVTQARSRGQRPRRRANSLDIEALVSKIREDNCAVRNRIVSAAIFVHAGAGVEWRRRNVRHSSIWGTANNDLSSAFLGSPLDPIDIVAVEPHLFKSDLTTCDNVSRNRRFPGAVRSCIWACHRQLQRSFLKFTSRDARVYLSRHSLINRMVVWSLVLHLCVNIKSGLRICVSA